MKNITKVKINNDFTPYTVDTYNMFTPEYEGLDDFDSFDMKAVVEEIGKKVATMLVDNYYAIKAASVTDVFIPKYYNYTTDAVELTCDVDMEEVETYIQEHLTEYGEFLQVEAVNYLRVSDEEKKVIFYIKNLHGDCLVSEYETGVYEDLLEIYFNNVCTI